MIRLTRELRFSLTVAAADSNPSADNTWAGAPASPELAPYLLLRATLSGEPDPTTGYLCDIKFVDDLLRESSLPLARQMLQPSRQPLWPDVLLLALWRRLPTHIQGVELVQLQLLTSPYIRYTISREQPHMVLYTEQFEFSAAHRLHCHELTEEQNRTLFGKCNNPHGHGHNYVLDVTVANAGPGPETLAARRRLGIVVKERVLDRFDHKHLNEDTVEFRSLNPTVENIARTVWELLVDELAPVRLVNVRVYETPKTWADCGG